MDLFSAKWMRLSANKRNETMAEYIGAPHCYVVILDDEPTLIEFLIQQTQDLGFTAFGTTSSEEALKFIEQHRSTTAMVISDVKMPKMDGFQFRQQVYKFAPAVPFTLMSGFIDRDTALKAVEFKIQAFMSKPIRENELLEIFTKESLPRLAAIREERELLKGFTDDATTLIENVEQMILSLEEEPEDQEMVSKIFGMIHTIKGSSGFFEPRTLHHFVHRFEDSLKGVQGGQASLTPPLLSAWLKSCDVIKKLIEELKTGIFIEQDVNELLQSVNLNPDSSKQSPEKSLTQKPSPLDKKGAPSPSATKSAPELKVAVGLLDEFMQISGEMTVIRNMISKIVKSIEKQYPTDKEVILLSELLGELHKINSSVQTKITEIRKVPIRSIVKPLQRIVRDTSQALGKEVQFKTVGDEIRIDNSVAEVLSNSLIHLIRNSIDHGIEAPDVRTASGKNERGEITIHSRIENETIFIEIDDDGKGISTTVIGNKLVKNGSHTESQIQKMTEDELLQMIFSPGFSTAAQITDISGRGVGMSMVKDVVESIGGKILIQSQVGKGSKFILSLPIPKSVLITNCLFISSQSMLFGIPQDQISRVVQFEDAVEKNLIAELEGTLLLRSEEELLPIFSLNAILQETPHASSIKKTAQTGFIVVFNVSGTHFCLQVDSVFNVEDTVVKAITASQIKDIGVYLGATFLGDGAIGLILNIEGIAKKMGLSRIGPKKHLESQLKNPKEDGAATNSYQMNVVICETDNGSLCAFPQDKLFRLEEFCSNQVYNSGHFTVTPYREKTLTLIDLQNAMKRSPSLAPDLKAKSAFNTLVVQEKEAFVGFVVKRVIDLVSISTAPESGTGQQFGSHGWLIHQNRPLLLLDVETLVEFIKTPQQRKPTLTLSAS